MNYIQRREAERQMVFEAGMELGYQQAIDFMCMALHDPSCMGAKGAFGGEKINRIVDRAMEFDHEFKKAFAPEDPEADVWQEKLDAAQRDIFKEKFQSFYVRYPYIKSVKYGKAK